MDKVIFINDEFKFNYSQLVRKNKGSIDGIDRKLTDSLIEVFNELRNNSQNEFKLSDLEEAFNKVREKNAAKVRVLKKQEASGFALVGALTVIGTIILSIIIFTIIGNIVM